MKFIKSKKGFALLSAVAVIAISAVGAYAYFTNSGSGTGTAQVGTSTAITIAGTVTPGVGGLVPGGNTADATFDVTNPGTGNAFVTNLVLASVDAYGSASDRTAGTPKLSQAACDTSVPGAFSMPTVAVSHNIAGGATYPNPAHGTITYHDTGVAQDGCQGAYLTFNFTSN